MKNKIIGIVMGLGLMWSMFFTVSAKFEDNLYNYIVYSKAFNQLSVSDSKKEEASSCLIFQLFDKYLETGIMPDEISMPMICKIKSQIMSAESCDKDLKGQYIKDSSAKEKVKDSAFLETLGIAAKNIDKEDVKRGVEEVASYFNKLCNFIKDDLKKSEEKLEEFKEKIQPSKINYDELEELNKNIWKLEIYITKNREKLHKTSIFMSDLRQINVDDVIKARKLVDLSN